MNLQLIKFSEFVLSHLDNCTRASPLATRDLLALAEFLVFNIFAAQCYA